MVGVMSRSSSGVPCCASAIPKPRHIVAAASAATRSGTVGEVCMGGLRRNGDIVKPGSTMSKNAPSLGHDPSFDTTPHSPRLSRKDSAMLDVHYWTTPNGHKITIFLEEA